MPEKKAAPHQFVTFGVALATILEEDFRVAAEAPPIRAATDAVRTARRAREDAAETLAIASFRAGVADGHADRAVGNLREDAFKASKRKTTAAPFKDLFPKGMKKITQVSPEAELKAHATLLDQLGSLPALAANKAPLQAASDALATRVRDLRAAEAAVEKAARDLNAKKEAFLDAAHRALAGVEKTLGKEDAAILLGALPRKQRKSKGAAKPVGGADDGGVGE